MSVTVNTVNSTYEVDVAGKRARRTRGVRPPTANQRADGEWRDYVSMDLVAGGLLFVWGVDGDVLRRTLTSQVVDANGDLGLPA